MSLHPLGFDRSQRQYDAQQPPDGCESVEDRETCPLHRVPVDDGGGVCNICDLRPKDYRSLMVGPNETHGPRNWFDGARQWTEDEADAAMPLCDALRLDSAKRTGQLATMTPTQISVARDIVCQQPQFGGVDGTVIVAALLGIVAREMVRAQGEETRLKANLAERQIPHPADVRDDCNKQN